MKNPILLCVVMALSTPGCLSISAIFNSNEVIKNKRTRNYIHFGAIISDLAVVAPLTGRAGNEIISNNYVGNERTNNKNNWTMIMLSIGWELIVVVDYYLAALIRRIIWGEYLTDDFP